MEDGTDSSEDNGRSQGIETKGDGGCHGVGGLGSHMRVLIDSVFDKRDKYNNLSSDCHMFFPHQFPLQPPLRTALTQQVEDHDLGCFCVDRSHHLVELERITPFH